MRWIELILSAPLFILSTGLLFQERFRQNPGVVVVAALIAVVSSIFTFQQVRGYIFPDPSQARAQGDVKIQNSNQQSDIILRELQKERAENQRLAAELAQQKQKKQNITNVATQQKPDTDQQRVEQLKDMGIALVDNVFQLMMGEISKRRQ